MTPAPAAALSQPLSLPCGTVLPNRLMKAAMSENLGAKSGSPTSGMRPLYQAWSLGGAGLVLTGNVMVDRRYVGEPGNVIVEDERHLPELTAWAKAGTVSGNGLWMQINHVGKQTPAVFCMNPVAPSAIRVDLPGFRTPRALTEAEIYDVIRRFATTATVAKKAGFTGVQIHAAHGYLLSQFLSPRHNQRTDQWGGSAEHRRRIILAIYQATRSSVGPHYPVGIKLNSGDFIGDTAGISDSLALIDLLTAAGIDLVEISGGTYEQTAFVSRSEHVPERVKQREAYFLDFADRVRQTSRVPLAVTGGFRSLGGMAAAVQSGSTDLIGLARPLALMPDAAGRLLAGTLTQLTTPPRISSGIKWLDQMLLLDITWYTRQLYRISRGRPTAPTMSVWRLLGELCFSLGFKSLIRVRG